MRVLAPVGLFSVMVPTLLALPVATPGPGAPRAHPVPSAVQSLAVHGVDRAALATAATPAAAAGQPFLLTAPTETRRFTTFGVTWEPGSGSPAVTVTARTRDEDGWSPWTELEVADDDGPDDVSAEASGPGVRVGTAPSWVGESTGVQVRVDVPTGPAPEDVRVDLVDPGESSADASLGAVSAPASTATAATRQPTVISRVQWGADESIRGAASTYATTVKVAYVHHTASTNDYTAAEAAAQVRGFYAYHVKSLGWSDIGYNFLVDKFGRIYEGRHGGISRAVIGAHAGGFNTGSTGVSMIGNHSTVKPSSATLASVRDLLAWKLSLSGADPLGKVVLTSGGGSSSKYPAGAKVTANVILGHRETNATSCPGDAGASALPALRTSVASVISGGSTATAPAPAPVPTSATAAIESKYKALGGSSGFLGTPTSLEAPAGWGRYRAYRGGSIFWTPETGAYEVHGAIAGKWVQTGSQSGPLGFPTTDESKAPDGVGRFNHFQNGSVYWTLATGAQEVRGDIKKRWAGLGWETSKLGYPLTSETPTRDGRGRFNAFQHGAIYWTLPTGAQEVRGAIRQRWVDLGAETSRLGYPTSNEGAARAGGRYNHFQSGSIYWSLPTGAHAVDGAIHSTWSKLGSENGPLGYPLSSEQKTPDARGRYNHFEQGSVYWTLPTGAQEVRGAIRKRWADLGWERSALGYPTTNEGAARAGGRYNHFQSGSIYWSPVTGAQAVQGAIHGTWRRLGSENGPLGYPITSETKAPDGHGRYNHFENGSVYWSSATGAREVRGAIRQHWAAQGWEAGPLGYPTSDEYAVPGGRRSDFRGGSIVWTPATGAVTIR